MSVPKSPKISPTHLETRPCPKLRYHANSPFLSSKSTISEEHVLKNSTRSLTKNDQFSPMWGWSSNSKRHVGPPPYAKPTIWKLSLLNKTRKSTISASSEILRRRLKNLKPRCKIARCRLIFLKITSKFCVLLYIFQPRSRPSTLCKTYNLEALFTE